MKKQILLSPLVTMLLLRLIPLYILLFATLSNNSCAASGNIPVYQGQPFQLSCKLPPGCGDPISIYEWNNVTVTDANVSSVIGQVTITETPPYTRLVYYVSDGGSWDNWDIYSYNIASGIETRLSYNPAIDNHPDISHLDSNRIVFSSNRGNGEFDIYLANADDIDGTAVRLTDDSHAASPTAGWVDPDPYPDRHPHWHPNGQLIIFTSRDRPSNTGKVITTLCSHPDIGKFYPKNISDKTYWVEYKICEGMNVIRVNPAGNVLAYVQLDIHTAWDSTNSDPGIRDIWIHGDSAYVGHPSFNSTGDKIVFTAAIDGEGKNWEIYTAGFDPNSISLIPNSLRRITYGPNETNNPIKMSGGAKFSNNDSLILFNSTRITSGNSQIYSVPAYARNWPVTSATQITFHEGNDYVPQPLPNSNIILITSDLGDSRLCNSCETGIGPTSDFDLVLLQGQSRTVIGNPTSQELTFIPDEVSWFCGTPPNLSACKFTPRIMNVGSLFLEHYAYSLIPPYILKNYGPNYCCNAKELYSIAFMRTMEKLYNIAPASVQSMMHDIMYLSDSTNFPGLNDSTSFDTTLLVNWLNSTTLLRMKKYVVPAIMDSIGLAYDGCPINKNVFGRVVPSPDPDTCKPYHSARQNLILGNYVVNSGGVAHLTAGSKILLLPESKIKSGGYLIASIVSSPSSEYCSGQWKNSPAQADKPARNRTGEIKESQLLFKVYPNPATQNFWVELLNEDKPCSIHIQVTDFMGNIKLFQNRTIVKRTQVFLNNQPPGMYFVKVVKGNQTGDQKVILN
jgi:Tol biopolymer transport system component